MLTKLLGNILIMNVSSRTLKLVEKEGMPILENGKVIKKGNLFVRFDIVFPKQLSEEVKGKLR